MKLAPRFCLAVLPLLACGLAQGAELAPEPEILGPSSLIEAGKLSHALRALDMLIARYPDDPRLPPLRTQFVAILEAGMPEATRTAPPRAVSRATTPRVPASREMVPGRDFSSGTANLAMIWIPPGRFLMSATLGSDDDTWVTLSQGFWIGQTEVTQEQWQAVLQDDVLPSFFKGSDRPMEWISWLSAVGYCRKLTELERAAGRLSKDFEYTLPTEAQWEWACRAGTTGSFAGDPEAMAWHAGNSQQQTHSVALKLPNAWGLYDMHGNVWEWCLDNYGGYPGGEAVDPRREDTTPGSNSARTSRGGAWGTGIGLCRSDYRARHLLNYTGPGVGLRVALVRVVAAP